MPPRVDFRSVAVFALFSVLPWTSPRVDGAEPSDPGEFVKRCADRVATAEASKSRAIAGEAPGWLFLTTEVKHLAAGEFWQDPGSLAGGDPIATIVAYERALAALGVSLVVVPVPAKAALYPDKLDQGASPDAVAPSAPLFARLAEAGVTAVDLEPVFRTARQSQKVSCEQDSHWTPWSCRLAAVEICKLPAVSGRFTIVDSPPRAGEEIKITGDLVDALPDAVTGKETLTVFKAAAQPVKPDDASPVILIGDSHTAVFSEAGGTIKNHTLGAGLRDHLQASFGFPLAVVTSAASGADGARAQLARKAAGTPDFWKGRKLVIWCFSAREFTQGRWRPIPAQPGK